MRTGAAENIPGGQGQDIWIGDLTRGTLTRLTFNEAALMPTWAPDGRRLAYERSDGKAGPATGREMVWRAVDGSGEAEPLLTGADATGTPDSFSPDGRYLLFHRWQDETSDDIWILPLDPPGDPRPFQATPFDEIAASISPDGKWVAYHSNESGRFEIYVRPFPEGAGKWQISQNGGFEPRWSPLGDELFFRADGHLMSVAVETKAGFRAATPVDIWQRGRFLVGTNPRSYAISPDAERFLALQIDSGSVTAPVVNFSNDWLARVRELLGQGTP